MSFGKIRKLTTERLSLRVRLTLLYVALFGASTLIFNGFLFFQTIESLQRDFDDALYNYAVDVSDSIEIGPKGDLTFPSLRVDDGKILPFPLGTALIQVRHNSGKILARMGEFGSFDPPFRRDFQKLSNGDEAAFRTIEETSPIPNAEADSYRLISLPLDSANSPQIVLQIAVPMTLLESQISNRMQWLQFGAPLVLLIATLGGLLLSGRALTPVRNMIDASKAIDASDLRQRIPVPQAIDEIQNLAQTLNEMLDRIEKAFLSQERFVADASHQLLTPLTILRGELELLLKSGRDANEVRDALRSALQEIDTLARIVQDMLLLARVDAGLGALNLEEIDFTEILLGAVRRCEKHAQAKKIRLIFDILGSEADSTFRGDRDLLENLFTNLLENAIKYSPSDQAVRVELESKTSGVEIRVSDEGPGIPSQEISLIFERFRRGPGAHQKTQGFGLGLAIARQIAQLHGAQLTAENKVEGGALFRFEMKKN